MLNRYEFEAVAKYLPADELAVKAIRKQFPTQAPELIKAIEAGESPDCDGEDVLTFLLDLLNNEARLYRRFTARGSAGNYHIDIRGLGGIYFYQAPEFGLTGYFLAVDDADSELTSNWNDSLTSYNGRSYRKPFVNKEIVEAIETANADARLKHTQHLLARTETSLVNIRMEEAIATSKADASLKQAQLLLSRAETSLDVTAWQELLALAPVRDTEACASLLERWFGSTLDLSGVCGLPHRSLFRVTLESCEPVFRILLARGQEALVQWIQVAADHEVQALTGKLKKTHGVARMALAQALGSARDRSKAINFAIQTVGSLRAASGH